jgi:hypothetical protein
VAFEATQTDIFARLEKKRTTKENIVPSDQSDGVATVKKTTMDVVPCSCIFKMGDDCRQDQLAIQVSRRLFTTCINYVSTTMLPCLTCHPVLDRPFHPANAPLVDESFQEYF